MNVSKLAASAALGAGMSHGAASRVHTHGDVVPAETMGHARYKQSIAAVGREIERLGKAIEAKKTSWPRKSPFNQGA